ncbi:putative membrane protein YdjX (TVP38/TMEM64 family) [Planomicrobium stackebrandtii]|uniref:TVP38/TMEM64 family membrane protein n=1 Tax=Planomicrobium stackebrandtii TaxID=253160 RepID=A0ABU0GTS0_9BACL|nr:VTT domain-containing protein [Planomicrobium stackebrandtii]MDQ0428761.1 putative membrane protein YdjX (TVP38/TMEM64 family) [Planomicrobium stackebrandtii]
MEQFDQSLEAFMDSVGWLAPFLFILLHLVRPLLFLPVIAVCVAGGFLFGFFEGAFLSFIGLTLMSWVSYLLVNKFPKFQDKMARLKDKIFPDRTLSVFQVMILRIMPFVHFHLLSLYLMEMTKTLKEYMIISALGLIAPAILYTAFGRAITEFPWYTTLSMFILLAAIFSFIEKWHNSKAQSN